MVTVVLVALAVVVGQQMAALLQRGRVGLELQVKEMLVVLVMSQPNQTIRAVAVAVLGK